MQGPVLASSAAIGAAVLAAITQAHAAAPAEAEKTKPILRSSTPTEALQRNLTRLPLRGGTLRLTTGSYTTNIGFRAPNAEDLILQGDGFNASTLNIAGRGVTGLVLGIDGKDRTQDISLRDIGVIGSTGSGDNIVFNNLHSADIDRVRTSWSGSGDGLRSAHSYATSYWMLYSNNNAKAGFHATAPEHNLGNDNLILWGGHLLANGTEGFWSEGQLVGALLAGVDVEGNKVGIQIDGGTGVSVSYSNTLLNNYLESQIGRNMEIGHDVGVLPVPALTILGNVINSGHGTAQTNEVLLDRVRSGFIVDNHFVASNFTTTSHTSRLLIGPNEFSGSVGPWKPSASPKGYREPILYELSGVGADFSYGFSPNGWRTRHTVGVNVDGRYLNLSANVLMQSVAGQAAPYDLSTGSSDIDLGPNRIALWRAAPGETTMTEVLGADARGTEIPRLKLDVLPTAALPRPGADQDGRIIIEDSGNGPPNLIIYAGGKRARVSGVTF